MIKSVLQSIPSYIMSIYLLSNSVIDDIEKMINAFWWGERSNNRGIKWMAWERVACPKEFGGMGFWNFKAFNLAMVAKQGWSFAWESIWNLCQLLLYGCRWTIEHGQQVSVMNDP
jgi:hypothetical protein